MDERAHDAFLAESVAEAAALLACAFGRPCWLEQEQSFRGPRSRSAVLRLRVVDGASGMPRTVIAKRFRGPEGAPYDPADAAANSSRARLLNEWAGARFLAEVSPADGFVPIAYAGDGARGLVLLEDLGDGECLADVLQAGDAVRATRALLAYATTLGRLHEATAGRSAAYARMRAALAADGGQPPRWDPLRNWQTDGLAPFQQACAALDLSIPGGAEQELADAVATLATPGPFDAYSVSDACPDNHRWLEGPTDAEPGTLRFFDMEFGGFQHALLDAAYVWQPFPTCWCVNRLPAELPPRLEVAYRAELVRGCPEAGDDRAFGRALTAAAAVWWVSSTAWQIIPALAQDDQWGIATHRQRFPLRAANFAALAHRHGAFPALGALAEAFAARLHARWGAAAVMPLYAAFR